MEDINALKTFCFDLDDTLCETSGCDYENCKPHRDRIEFVNKLYDQGHTIFIDSARGSGTGIYWTSKTKEQLER